MEAGADQIYLWHEEPHQRYPNAPGRLPFQLARELSKYGHPVPHFHVILSFLELLTVVWQSRNLPASIAHPQIDTSLAHLYSMDLAELERLQNVASASLIPMAYAIREGIEETPSGMSWSIYASSWMLQRMLSLTGQKLPNCSEGPWSPGQLLDLNASDDTTGSSEQTRLFPETSQSSETLDTSSDSNTLPILIEEHDLQLSGDGPCHRKRNASSCAQAKKRCPYCGKVYQVAGHFRNHLRIHREYRHWQDVIESPDQVEEHFTPISSTQWKPATPEAGTSELDNVLPYQRSLLANPSFPFQAPSVQINLRRIPSSQSDPRNGSMHNDTLPTAFQSNHFTRGNDFPRIFSGSDIDDSLPPATPTGHGTKRRRISEHYVVESASPVCSADDMLLTFHQNVAF